MTHDALRAVVRKQWLIVSRDRRFRLLNGILLFACLATFISASARNEGVNAQIEVARQANAHSWTMQGTVNPHQAAHFGHHAFQPVSTLSAFDPGILDYVGTVLRLEAHKQSPASGRTSDTGMSLTRFSSLHAASILQMLAPLLIVLVGFGTFAGEQSRTLLRQELGTGVHPRVLALGQLLAWGAVIIAVLALFSGAALIVLLVAGAAREEFLRLISMTLGYGLYLFTFLALTLGVSALCRSSRAALISLLAFWVVAVLLIPRIAPSIAAHVFPTPSVQGFHADVESAVDAHMDGDGSREDRPQRLRAMILERYGVEKIEDLPVNLSGVLLEYSETASTQSYQQHFSDLYGRYERQAALQRWFAIGSPLMALKPWSAALAGSDFSAHHKFLLDAEAYRYEFVQALNRDITENRANTNDDYARDVAQITASLGEFRSSGIPPSAVLERYWPDLMALVAWAALSLVFALWSVGRLRAA